MSARRLALGLVTAATLAIAVAYASAFLPGGAPAWAPWCLAMGTSAIMVGMMLLGASRRGGVGRLGWVFLLVFLWVAAGFAVLLALPAADPAEATLWLGLPPRAAVLMYGIGLAPLLVVPVAYAFTFDRLTLGEADLERVRAAGGRTSAGSGANAGAGDDDSAASGRGEVP